MKLAFLFPGQGSQFVGMAADLSDAFDLARAVIEEADEVLGFSLSEKMFGSRKPEADADADALALRQTDITQPALFAHSMAAIRVLRSRGESPRAVAGHSLGEYSALCAAGAITFEDGLRTVRLRGQLMAGVGDARPGSMAAVLGADDDAIDRICESVSTPTSVVQPANYNAPGQIVISGDTDAVERAMAIAKEEGARRVIPLPVSGAFHSPLMEEARTGLGQALKVLEIKTPACPVYLNVSALPSSDPEVIRQALLDQLTSPVRWSQTLVNMQHDGTTTFAEIGAGKVLSGLVRRTLGREVTTVAYGTVTDFER